MGKLIIGGIEVQPGEIAEIELPVARLYTATDIAIPVHVVRAKKQGPVVFVSAAVHGDELNGIEIIRRLIGRKSFRLTKGDLIVVPIVNIYGVLSQSRYMPDRRDLNRSFPGSSKGTLAGRVANLFLSEIVSQCDYGIDLHTGAIHRSNLPQIRADLSDSETSRLALAFGAPVLIHANLRDGSLRQAALEMGAKILLYEGGEALRFDEFSIRVGVQGILNVLASLGMVRARRKKPKGEPFVTSRSAWVRAPASGLVSNLAKLGDHVSRGDLLAEIVEPLGNVIDKVRAARAGVIIGKQNIPLVQEGEAMYHVAYFDEPDDVAEHIDQLEDSLLRDDTISR